MVPRDLFSIVFETAIYFRCDCAKGFLERSSIFTRDILSHFRVLYSLFYVSNPWNISKSTVVKIKSSDS